MVVGARRSEVEEAYRRGHRLGNRLFTGLLAGLFGRSFTDIFSGYRVFSRRFVKILPGAVARLRDRDRDFSVHALELAMPVAEMVTAYGARPEGSVSKLSTYSDGWRIARTILHLFRIERPVLFYGGFAAFLVGARPRPRRAADRHLREDRPRPALPDRHPDHRPDDRRGSVFAVGLILDTVVRGRREVRRLHYLSFPAVGEK